MAFASNAPSCPTPSPSTRRPLDWSVVPPLLGTRLNLLHLFLPTTPPFFSSISRGFEFSEFSFCIPLLPFFLLRCST